MFYKWTPEKIVDFKKLNTKIRSDITKLFEEKNQDFYFLNQLHIIVDIEHNLSEEIDPNE